MIKIDLAVLVQIIPPQFVKSVFFKDKAISYYVACNSNLVYSMYIRLGTILFSGKKTKKHSVEGRIVSYSNATSTQGDRDTHIHIDTERGSKERIILRNLSQVLTNNSNIKNQTNHRHVVVQQT